MHPQNVSSEHCWSERSKFCQNALAAAEEAEEDQHCGPVPLGSLDVAAVRQRVRR